jgi:UDP-N-acetylglucosamine:LPS N-acetylglucosamine transferase
LASAALLIGIISGYACHSKMKTEKDSTLFRVLLGMVMHGETKAGAAVDIGLKKKKILAVSSGGGHWVELIRLSPAFEGYVVVYATVDKAYRSEAGSARFYTIRDVTRWNKLRWVQTFVKLAYILLREEPDVVISTGALPGYFSLRLAKLFGAKTIWVDSIANVDELSLSGQMIGKHADLWLTQWPQLAKPSGPLYRGAVL